MTLRDMMEQITIQGNVVIKRFEDDGETEITIMESCDFECDRHKLADDTLDRAVQYLYPVSQDMYMSFVCIELE